MVMLTKTGTFDAAIATGNQAVVGVGFTPRALLIWGSGATTDGAFETAAFIQGIGFATSPTNQYAQTSAAATSASTNVRRRVETCAFIQTDITATAIIRRANLVSMDADGFTLNWTIARTNGDYDTLHYLALGGDDLTGAKVVNWQTPTVTGNKAVTGVGFQPDCALHVHAGGVTALSDGGSATQAASLGVGVMTATSQWATGYMTFSTSAHARNQESDKTLTVISGAGAIAAQAAYASMDSDGFTTNFGVAGASAYQVISLCLKGGQYNAGRIVKSTAGAPASQAVTGIGFTPTGVLLAGVQDIVRAGPLAGSGVAYGLGASDGTTEWGSALYGAATATRKNISKSGKAYVKVNTTGSVIDAEADLTSFDADGLTLNWTTNDAVATSIPHLAMGSNVAGAAHPLTTAVAGTSSVTASAIRLSHPLASAVGASSAVTAGGLTLSHPLTATAASAATTAATGLAVGHALTATVGAASAVTATSLRLTHPLAGIIAATSTATATGITASHPLTTTVAGTSTVTGALVTPTGTHPLTATIAGTSTITASALRLDQPLTSLVAGSSTVAVSGLRIDQPLTGAVTGLSTATAVRLVISHPLTAIAAATSTATAGRLTTSHPLIAYSAGTSSVVALISQSHPLVASVAGSSTVTAVFIVPITSAITFDAADANRTFGAADRAMTYAATDTDRTYDGSTR